jgi:hypothetical protein
MIRGGSTKAATRAVRLELGARRSGVKHFAEIYTTSDEFAARRLYVGGDEVKALRRAGRG